MNHELDTLHGEALALAAAIDRLRQEPQDAAHAGHLRVASKHLKALVLGLAIVHEKQTGEVGLFELEFSCLQYNPDFQEQDQEEYVEPRVPISVQSAAGLRVILGNQPHVPNVMIERQNTSQWLITVHPDSGDPFCHIVLRDEGLWLVEDPSGMPIHQHQR